MRCSGIRGQARRRSRCGVPRTGQSDQSKERSCGLSNPYYLLPIEKSSALVNQKQKLFTSWHLLPCRVRVDLEVRTGLLAEMRLMALALVTYFATIQLANWPERLRYPGEEDAVEGTQLSETVHLRRGAHICRLPSNGEFDSAIYGPLCYLLGAAVIDPNRPDY